MADRVADQMKKVAGASLVALVVLLLSNLAPAFGSEEVCLAVSDVPEGLCVTLEADLAGPPRDLTVSEDATVFALFDGGRVVVIGRRGEVAEIHVPEDAVALDHAFDSLFVATSNGLVRHHLDGRTPAPIAAVSGIQDVTVGRLGRVFLAWWDPECACTRRKVVDGLDPEPAAGRDLGYDASALVRIEARPGTDLVYGVRSPVGDPELVELGDDFGRCDDATACSLLPLPMRAVVDLAFADLGGGFRAQIIDADGRLWSVDPETGTVEPVDVPNDWRPVRLTGSIDGSLVLAGADGRIRRLVSNG